VIYTGDGDRSVPKERLEVYGAGRSAILDDFRITTLHSGGKQRRFKTRTQDKGFVAELDAFLTLLESGASGDAVFAAARLSMLATLKAQRSLALREPLTIG
jgi:polar amino acid transport system substrate-binding protein